MSNQIDERWYDGSKVTKAELAAEVTLLRAALTEITERSGECGPVAYRIAYKALTKEIHEQPD